MRVSADDRQEHDGATPSGRARSHAMDRRTALGAARGRCTAAASRVWRRKTRRWSAWRDMRKGRGAAGPASMPGRRCRSAARAVVEADAVDHLGRGLAVLRDLGERQRVGRSASPKDLTIVGGGEARLDRIFEGLLGIDLLRLVAGQEFDQLHAIVAVAARTSPAPRRKCSRACRRSRRSGRSR